MHRTCVASRHDEHCGAKPGVSDMALLVTQGSSRRVSPKQNMHRRSADVGDVGLPNRQRCCHRPRYRVCTRRCQERADDLDSLIGLQYCQVSTNAGSNNLYLRTGRSRLHRTQNMRTPEGRLDRSPIQDRLFELCHVRRSRIRSLNAALTSKGQMMTSFRCLSLPIVSLCLSPALTACIRWCSRRGQPALMETTLCTQQQEDHAIFRSQRVERRAAERFEFFAEYEVTDLMMCPISVCIDMKRHRLEVTPTPPKLFHAGRCCPGLTQFCHCVAKLIKRRCCEPNLSQWASERFAAIRSSIFDMRFPLLRQRLRQ